MRIMCFTDHDKSWLKYERVCLSNCSFPSVKLHLQFSEWTWIAGSFFTWRDKNICIYFMSSIQALNKKYGKCLPEKITQSLKNFPSIIPHTFLSAAFLPPTTRHLSKENNARLFNGLVIIRKLLWYIGMLSNGVCMVCGEKCNLILHPFCCKFNWNHWENIKLR